MTKAEKYRLLYLKHLNNGGNKRTIKWYYYKWCKYLDGREVIINEARKT